MKHAPYISAALLLSVLGGPVVRASDTETAAQAWLGAIRVPEFPVPSGALDWQKERAATRAKLWSLLGDFPETTHPPSVTVESRSEHDGYVLEKFSFQDAVGQRVPGYLFLPKGVTRKVPAILYCHWHAGQYEIGKEEMLRTNATPVEPGPDLARRGYAVLGVDACCFGERNGRGPAGDAEMGTAGELSASKLSLWAGRTLWGTIIRDDLLALDYLCSRPEVDPGRIGVTGISMGSTRSWWIMALDDRPKTAVCVACMTRYQDLVRAGSLKEHGIYYFVPGMLKNFDTEAVISCAAPRPILFLTGDRDPGSPIGGIRALESRVGAVYSAVGADGQFKSVIFPNTAHVYLPAMWHEMTAWMDQHLRNGS